MPSEKVPASMIVLEVAKLPSTGAVPFPFSPGRERRRGVGVIL